VIKRIGPGVTKRRENYMINRPQEKAYREFSQLAYSNDTLDPKTTHLVKIATAMSIGCYP
jgi:alkylhydroperoxidase/carboxymuconolactone decarboxylase family protein YurZ